MRANEKLLLLLDERAHVLVRIDCHCKVCSSTALRVPVVRLSPTPLECAQLLSQLGHFRSHALGFFLCHQSGLVEIDRALFAWIELTLRVVYVFFRCLRGRSSLLLLLLESVKGDNKTDADAGSRLNSCCSCSSLSTQSLHEASGS